MIDSSSPSLSPRRSPLTVPAVCSACSGEASRNPSGSAGSPHASQGFSQRVGYRPWAASSAARPPGRPRPPRRRRGRGPEETRRRFRHNLRRKRLPRHPPVAATGSLPRRDRGGGSGAAGLRRGPVRGASPRPPRPSSSLSGGRRGSSRSPGRGSGVGSRAAPTPSRSSIRYM